MITYVLGDLFTSPATVLVNTVNTVGVMGKGIAKDFKTYFPDMLQEYQSLCEAGRLQIGSLHYYRTPHKSVLNFPTKRHWKAKSRLEDIEAGLKTFVAKYREYSIMSVAFPQLGCGNGELDWESQVRPLMERYLGSLPITIYIHIYDSGSQFSEHRDVDEMKQWLRSEPASLPFSEVWDDIVDVVGTSLSLSSQLAEGWTVAIEESEEPALRFQQGATQIAMPYEDLRDEWEQLRSFGLLTANDMPDVYRSVGEPLILLLKRLDYIHGRSFVTRRASTSDNGTSMPSLMPGVQFVPETSSPEATEQMTIAGFA